MAQKAHGLSHAKWMCKYHIVFTPKYRRKATCSQIRSDIGEILRKLCEYKGIEIIEGRLMPDHVHVPLAIPPKYSVASVMGCLKGKSSLMIFDGRANLKYRFGNRGFWAEGRYVSTVGLNEATIAKYIREQESHDVALDKLGVKEHEDPFKRRRACRFDRRAAGQDALGLDEARARAFRREPGARGLYPKSKPPFLRVVMIILLDFSCSRCSFPSDYSDHFLVNINIAFRTRSAHAARTPRTAAFDGSTVRHHSAASRAAGSRFCSARWLHAFAITVHPLTSPMQRTVLARYRFVRTTVVPPVPQTNHLASLLPSRGRGAPLATARSRPWRQSACCRLP